MVVDSCGINYTGKQNLLHNDHQNNSHGTNKKSYHNKSEINVSTCILVLVLVAWNIQHINNRKGYCSSKCTYQSQQSKLRYLQKNMIVLMRVAIVMVNQHISMIWKISKIIKIVMRMIYLMFSHLMLVKFSDNESNE